MPDKIDVVYTWVDGSSAEFQRTLHATLEAYKSERGEYPDVLSTGANRFRDYGTLRHSLRSIHQFVPWADRIFIVTNGQVPDWLDLAHPRIQLVTHREIFPDAGVLPTFNSSAIDTNLRFIPGLSRHFLYVNDDILFGREALLGDFFSDSGRLKVRFQTNYMNRDLQHPIRQARKIAYCGQLLDQRFGVRSQRRNSPHTPVMFDRTVLDRLEADWPEPFQRTRAHKFRDERDIAMHILFLHYLAETYGSEGDTASAAELIEVMQGQGSGYIPFGDPAFDLDASIAQIWRERPRYICVNDVMGEFGDISEAHMAGILATVSRFLSGYYPAAAPWEK